MASSQTSVNNLVSSLESLSVSQPKLVKRTAYTFPPDVTPFGSSSSQSHALTSWKMAEHMYKADPCMLPTLARGLFTEQLDSVNGEKPGGDKSEKGNYRIVARGYEKFFNIDEMSYTKWDSLESHTLPPYHLTLKSNGCLIMISAIEEDVLLVTSKHALGKSGGPDGEEEGGKSHAEMGKEWLQKHLDTRGTTEAEMARALWDKNMTAVAELCDDSFEEHVLPYPAHLTGLHLHGLNLNVAPAFVTLPPDEVSAFARQWGLIETKALVMQSLKEVREFTRGVEERGEWQGEPVEGFVVRCTVGESQEGEPDVVQGESAETGEGSKQKKSNNRESSKLEDEVEKLALWVEDESAHSTSSPDTHTSRPPKPSVTPARTRQLSPPYPSGSTFFFKIKFNQPYLLYRNFREITKLLLPLISSPPGSSTPALNQPSSSSTKKTKSSKALEIPKSKLQDVDSQAYEFWCRKSMGEHPDWFEGVGRGKGIVAARDRFFEWKAGEEGMRVFKELALEMRKKGKAVAGESRRDRGKDGWGKTMIVPIAVPGCGKTAISLMLSRLFGFAHTQSDDVQAKKTGPKFVQAVAELLKKPDVQVVIADRNNHLANHRTELSQASVRAQTSLLPIRIVALNWSILPPKTSLTQHELHRICSSRIISRGTKHQSLRADPLDLMRHEIIVQRFFDQHQPLDVATEAVDEVVELKVEDGLRENLQVVIGRLVELLPGLEKPSEQKVDEAMDWVKSYDPSVKKDVDGTPTTPPRYYALAPEIDVVKTVQKVFASSPTASPDALVEPKQFLDRLIGEQRITAKPHITLVHERNVQDELAQLNPLLPSTSSASSQSPSSPKIESTSILDPSLHLAASTAASETTSSSASSPNPSSSPPQTGPISLTWSRCQSIASDPTRPLYSFRLTHLVWNARVMALVVSRLSPLSPSSPTLPLDDEEGMHLTVGTASADIPAVESRPLVRAFRRGEMSEGMGVLAFGGDGEFGKGRVKGLS